MDNNSLAHTKWECKYHLVFAPKYRRQVIYKEIKADADRMPEHCRRKGIEIIEAECMPGSRPYAGENSSQIFRIGNSRIFKGKKFTHDIWTHANLKYKYGNRHFWCRGYYVDTVGKNTATIKEYIQNQIKEDLECD